MASLFVVFYRNMNLGHPGSPDRATLEEVLVAAGARTARSFQTNGTVLLDAGNPAKVVSQAAGEFKTAAGYTDAAMVRSLDELAEVLEGKPFEGHKDSRTYRETFTFFDGDKPLDLQLPWTNRKDDVDIIALHDGLALSTIRKFKSSAGSPTAEIERLTGAPATTRTLGTIERLIEFA
ncbi:DUF1697 domain-containing protein [Streptomyces longisporoflavus]|uniref:DUF1697 domain-containing protein n=1 Tax=Streptomyces longisporoflavus TaxID=28044 RepID=A0ABW7QIN5_9ACTN